MLSQRREVVLRKGEASSTFIGIVAGLVVICIVLALVSIVNLARGVGQPTSVLNLTEGERYQLRGTVTVGEKTNVYVVSIEGEDDRVWSVTSAETLPEKFIVVKHRGVLRVQKIE